MFELKGWDLHNSFGDFDQALGFYDKFVFKQHFLLVSG